MAWRIEFESTAVKELRKLDSRASHRILKFLRERVASAEDPRSLGAALKGSKFGTFWKYRVGDYRLIAHIDDGEVCVLVVRVGNRREIYKR